VVVVDVGLVAMDRPLAPPIALAADELTTLTAFLDSYRAALLDRAWGLTSEQMNASHPPSSLTLTRLIGHMSGVEMGWFFDKFDGETPPQWIEELDWNADPDAEMTRAETLSPEVLIAEFKAQCEDSRRRTASAESLDQLIVAEHCRPIRAQRDLLLRDIQGRLPA
jgi:hypothetical protein